MPENGPGEGAADTPVRKLVFAVLAFGMLGTLAELYLLEHTEDWWQRLPLILLTVGLATVLWSMARPGPASLRCLQGLMAIFVVAGAVGVYQHYSGNAEFEREIYESKAGFELFYDSLKGATPTLAPGTMTMFGLLGLAATLRHPRLLPTKEPT